MTDGRSWRRTPIRQQKRTPPNNQGGVGRQQQQQELVRLFSAAQDRAPNATMLYLSSKIKATRSKTVDWIQDQPEDQQRRHISLAITVAPAGSQRHSSEVHLEIVWRLQQKELKRQHIKMKQLETKLRALKSKTVREISYVLNCGEEKAKIIQDILQLLGLKMGM